MATCNTNTRHEATMKQGAPANMAVFDSKGNKDTKQKGNSATRSPPTWQRKSIKTDLHHLRIIFSSYCHFRECLSNLMLVLTDEKEKAIIQHVHVTSAQIMLVGC